MFAAIQTAAVLVSEPPVAPLQRLYATYEYRRIQTLLFIGRRFCQSRPKANVQNWLPQAGFIFSWNMEVPLVFSAVLFSFNMEEEEEEEEDAQQRLRSEGPDE